MKKTQNLVLIAFLLPILIQAQSDFGIKSGLNFSELSGKYHGINEGDDAFGYRTGWHAGFFWNRDLSERFGVEIEAIYNLFGANSTVSTGFGLLPDPLSSPKIDLKYIHVPLLVRYHVFSKLSVELGPGFGFLLNEKDFTPGFIDNTFDIGGKAGMSFHILEHLAVSGSYVHSFNALFKTNYTDINGEVISRDVHKNSVFQISLEYNFLK